MRCGVLALQGDYAVHQKCLQNLGVASHPVRTPSDLDRADALVLPGGESSAVNKLLEIDDLGGAISKRLNAGMPVLATCCGIILLARGVDPEQETFGVLDVDVVRNAYGRQIASTVVEVEVVEELARTSHQVPSRGRRGAVPSGVFDLKDAESYSTVRRASRSEKTPLGAVHRRPQQKVGEKGGLEFPSTMEGVFIRAPRVTRVGPGISVLGRRGDDPVLLRSATILAATFHPELTTDPRVHQLFIRIMEERDV